MYVVYTLKHKQNTHHPFSTPFSTHSTTTNSPIYEARVNPGVRLMGKGSKLGAAQWDQHITLDTMLVPRCNTKSEVIQPSHHHVQSQALPVCHARVCRPPHPAPGPSRSPSTRPGSKPRQTTMVHPSHKRWNSRICEITHHLVLAVPST